MEKLTKLRAQFEQLGIDGLLVASTYNRRYMTGFTGTAGVALISAREAVFITDFRYTEQAAAQIKNFEIVELDLPIHEQVAEEVGRLQIKNLGFEQDHLTYSEYMTYNKVLPDQLIPISAAIEKLRLIKTEAEIKMIKGATEIADAAFAHILTFIEVGMKERDVANELEFFMRKMGADSSSFEIIVASGLRSALPHGVASDKRIEAGDMVTLDFGAYYKGYVSDITRTIAVGEPREELKEIYAIVLAAQLYAVANIKPGMTCKEADALARDYIKEKGFGEQFGHGTGHGIGLEVHEGPSVSMRSNVVLEPGMVITVEPGIYVPSLGGVRIEDDVLITEKGNERLTHSRKELIII